MKGRKFSHIGRWLPRKLTSTSKPERFYAPGLMDLGRYHIAAVTSDLEWSNLVNESEQGTLFNTTTFLNAIGSDVVNMGCYKGDELMAGISFLKKGECAGRSDLMIYTGPFVKRNDENQSLGNQTAENFRTTSALVLYLTDKYENIELQTHWSFNDIRPFLWHNYGQMDSQFSVSPKYTAVVQVSGADELNLEQNLVYMRCSKSRRQEIRYAIKAGIEVTEETDLDILEHLVRESHSRQNRQVDDDALKRTKKVCKALIRAGCCKMYCARTSEGELGSLAVFAYDSKRAYYLYGANTEIARTHHTGSLVLWHALVEMARLGLPEVDLEGVNSPSRGHFKLSFGGELRAYFNLTL